MLYKTAIADPVLAAFPRFLYRFLAQGLGAQDSACRMVIPYLYLLTWDCYAKTQLEVASVSWFQLSTLRFPIGPSAAWHYLHKQPSCHVDTFIAIIAFTLWTLSLRPYPSP